MQVVQVVGNTSLGPIWFRDAWLNGKGEFCCSLFNPVYVRSHIGSVHGVGLS